MGKCSEILAALSYSVNPRVIKDTMMMMMMMMMITYPKLIYMIWLAFGLGGFAKSFFLSLERKIFVSFMKDKNID